jgi:gliding motility-associated-like protein
MVGEYPYHLIYRNDGEDGPLVLIDSVNVNVNGFRYMDQGQYNGVPLVDTKNYCYLVETRGSYGNDRVIAPLLNKSQVVCAMPNDLIPPCEPALSLDLESLEDCQNYLADKPCNFNSFSNTLRWTDQEGTNCDDDIRRYNIYYSPTGEEGTFKIVSPPDLTGNTFVHKNLLSLAGCYMITSVDRSGNESPFSEMICNENCTNYELPNVFTPNGDDINDTFRPKDCPRFVESVTLRVVNRWGKEVYSFTSSGDISIFINWDGKTNDGQELLTGVYYYVAEVKFTMRDPSRAHQTFKGWVQILR